MEGFNLITGDCLEVMKHVPDNAVDLVLADLPYGTTQCKWDSIIPMGDLWSEYWRVAKPNAAVILTAMQPFASFLVTSQPQHFKYEWVWEKGNATGFLNAKKQPLRAHESVLVFYRSQPTYNPQKTSGHVKKTTKRKTVNSECYGKALKLTEYDSTDRYPRSVQFFSSDKQKGNFHPTQKPVALMEYIIKTYTDEGMTVLDNAMGSGTTGVACALTRRKFIGIEKDKFYTGVAESRIKTVLERPVLI